jgi:hypothetical protein
LKFIDSSFDQSLLEAISCRFHDASNPPCSMNNAIASRKPYNKVEQIVWW